MSAIRVPLTLARTLRPTVIPRALSILPSTRLLSTSSPLSFPPSPTTNLASSAGSGQGGKSEKEAARKQKEQAKKEKEKERVRKEKERSKLLKEREKAKAQKEKDKANKEKEKLKLAKDKEKAKSDKEKAKLKLKAVKDKKPRTASVLRPPKAPTNSWGIFLGDFIAERKRSLPAGEKIGSLADVTKLAGHEYSQLDQSAKSELQQRAEEQRAAYPAILEEWKKTLTPEMIREENTVRATRRKLGLSRKANLKLTGEPKRPKTAYFLFLTEQREKGPDSDVLKGETRIIEQSKLVAAAWRALSDEEKKRYNDLYETDKGRYEQEKADFDTKLKKSVSAT